MNYKGIVEQHLTLPGSAKYLPTTNNIDKYILMIERFGLLQPLPDGQNYNNCFDIYIFSLQTFIENRFEEPVTWIFKIGYHIKMAFKLI